MATGTGIGTGICFSGSKSWSSYWNTRYVDGVAVTALSDTSLSVTHVNHGTADYTGHKYYVSTDNVNFTLNKTLASIGTSTTLTGLTAATLYYVKVAPYKDANIGTLSSAASATTYLAELFDGNTVAWYKFDNLSKVTTDLFQRVANLKDLSGNNNDLPVLNTTSEPQLQEDGILFEGVGSSMRQAFTFAQPEFIYMIIKQVEWQNNRYFCNGVDSSTHYGAVYMSTSTPQIGAYAGSASGRSSDLAVGSWGVVRCLFNGANSKLIVNNNAAITGNFGSNNMNGFCLGAAGTGSFSKFMVKEVILRKSTNGEAAIYNYLASRLTATVNLDNMNPLANMPLPKDQHGFEACNGKLYSVGGRTALSSPKKLYEYNPLTNTWATKADMPWSTGTERQSASWNVVNGKLYFIGGLANPAVLYGEVYMYDPSNDTWTQKATMPTVREDYGSAVYNGKIYCFGGINKETGSYAALKILEVYDPVANTWDITKADMPTEKCFGDFGICCNGKIYAISASNTYVGYPDAAVVSTTVYRYDPETNTWDTVAPIPVGVAYCDMVAVGTNIYVVGGWKGGNSLAQPLINISNKVYKYDTVADSWSEHYTLQTPLTGAACCAYNGEIYVNGGYYGYYSLKSLFKFTA